ncbi:diacylglycerol/polyprenol kinase family protein [Methanolobus bombayensis]|uniref:diacylglycerol/polyprenol kinase family protein n=1 Tax=Methanolobus bombayensis TaxID=38023 RepID=UPI001AE20490|nr:diacylglycerol/polyprenol kinase family protein [Methanolobus bombayensis]MBP1907937.1 dolichol kinase [Methanolobus bombayensis]
MTKNKVEDNPGGDSERKLVHVVSGLAYIPLVYFFTELSLYVLFFLEFIFFSIVVSLVLLKAYRYQPVFDMIHRWGRKKENYIPLKPTLLVNTGILITYLLFPVNVVCAAIAITALGDGIATVAGEKLGKHKLPYSKRKTYEGTLAGIIVAFAGAVIFVSHVQALSASVGALLIESVIGRDFITDSSINSFINLLKNDNLVLPIASGFIMIVFG